MAVDELTPTFTAESADDELPDPDAPYGRNAAGKPYKMDPEARAALTAKLAAGVERAKAEGRRGPGRPKTQKVGSPARRASPNKSTPAKGIDRTGAIAGTLDIPIGLTALLAKKWPVLIYDSMVLTQIKEPLAEAVDELAADDETIAKYVDKVTILGPYTKIMNLLTKAGLQIAANHGKIPISEGLGIVSKETLVAEMRAAAAKEEAERDDIA